VDKHPNIHQPEKGFGDVYTIRCEEYIDASNKTAFEAAILKCVDDGNTRIVLDFSDLDYMSSAGANVIISTVDRIRKAGGDLLVLKPTDNVRDVLDILGLDVEINIALEMGAALRFFRDLDSSDREKEKLSNPPADGS
jgi:anti-anti-sigma factor